MALTCNSESPKVHNVRQPHKNGQSRHGEGRKQHLVTIRPRLQLLLVRLHPLECARAAAEHAATTTTAHLVITLLRTHELGLVVLQGLKGRQGELGLVLVRASNVLHDANGFFVLALVHQELGALTELEHEEPEAKDS